MVYSNDVLQLELDMCIFGVCQIRCAVGADTAEYREARGGFEWWVEGVYWRRLPCDVERK
jgi:hypothetical protein